MSSPIKHGDLVTVYRTPKSSGGQRVISALAQVHRAAGHKSREGSGAVWEAHPWEPLAHGLPVDSYDSAGLQGLWTAAVGDGPDPHSREEIVLRPQRRMGHAWVGTGASRRSLQVALGEQGLDGVDDRVMLVLGPGDSPDHVRESLRRLLSWIGRHARSSVVPVIEVGFSDDQTSITRTELAAFLTRDQWASLGPRSTGPLECSGLHLSPRVSREPIYVVLGTGTRRERLVTPVWSREDGSCPYAWDLDVVEAHGDPETVDCLAWKEGAVHWRTNVRYDDFYSSSGFDEGYPFLAVRSRHRGQRTHGIWVSDVELRELNVRLGLITDREAAAHSADLEKSTSGLVRPIAVDATVRSALGIEIGEGFNVVPITSEFTYHARPRSDSSPGWFDRSAARALPANTTLVRVTPSPLAVTEQDACFIEPWLLPMLGIDEGDEVVLEGVQMLHEQRDGELPPAESPTIAELRSRTVKAYAAPDSLMAAVSGSERAGDLPLGLARHSQLGSIWLDREAAAQLGVEGTYPGLGVRSDTDDRARAVVEPTMLATLRIRADRSFAVLKHAREFAIALCLLSLTAALTMTQIGLADQTGASHWWYLGAAIVAVIGFGAAVGLLYRRIKDTLR